MSAVQPMTSDSFLERLAQYKAEPCVNDAGWLKALRVRAGERVAALGFPCKRDEAWRFTDLSALSELALEPACAQTLHAPFADFERLIFPEAAATRLVFVNGHYAPELSDTHDVPRGVTLTPLSARQCEEAMSVAAHLARYADMQHDVFAALNTRLFADAALLHIGRDVVCERPLHLLFIATAQQGPILNSPRCLVVGERGSICTLVEEYVGLGEGVTFTNAVSEMVVEEGAHVRHVRLQDEPRTAFHMTNHAVALARDACYQSIAITLGARLSRYNLAVAHQAPGTECVVKGLTLVGGQQLADTHSVIDHAASQGSSTQLNKCIVDESAHAVFNGKIVVRRDAQMNDARQQSRNLLLSARARINTKPELLILADDVKCSHGATVGQLDEEQVFYLKCRGISDSAARNLLTYAFAGEIIEKIPLVSLRSRLSALIRERIHAHAAAEVMQ
ncbi:MAG: Fe-S cluster assembly protein SufD [Gammaproteobacteria bacterium]|nr:Fe-S cluster assembly protein SufD [Gammaproteobacteria bacterium]